MIIATAGHVDHGKSTLTRLLTGTDTDRLAEEKARGLSIDLGFAYIPAPAGGTLGVVDVPGHEQFVANMLAGVGAVDGAMLVVAADDGPMPQTDEHLDIIRLLQVPRGVIVITKTDRADAARIESVEKEIRERLMGTALADAPVFRVSNLTGVGIDALRSYLFDLSATVSARRQSGHFRMAIDRRFTLKGAGLIVTGSAFSGAVAAGDQLALGALGRPARVRALRAQNSPAQEGGAGERLALNLAGPDLSKDIIRRGDWLVSPQACHPTDRIDARLYVLSGEERPFTHNRTVHFHFGALDSPARVAVLDGRKIDPGQSGLVQIVLDRPTIAVNGDRFVLRDQSARRTIAGGFVLDPFGPARGRARSVRIEILEILECGEPAAVLRALLEQSASGVDLVWFARAMNLTPSEAAAVFSKVPFIRAGGNDAPIAVSVERWNEIQAAIVESIEKAKAVEGVPASVLARLLPTRISPALLASALAELVRFGRLRSEGQLYESAVAPRRPQPPKNAMGEKILCALRDSGVPPATVSQLAERTGIPVKLIVGFLNRAAAEGAVRRVTENRFFLPETVAQIASETETLAAAREDGLFKTSDFSDLTGIGRRPGVEILEYFDKTGFTRRRGDDREIVRPAGEVFVSR